MYIYYVLFISHLFLLYIITNTFSVLYSLLLLSSFCIGGRFTHDFHSRKSELSAVENICSDLEFTTPMLRLSQVVLLLKSFKRNTDPLERDTTRVITA
jgi:hypothetical protein